VPPGRGRRRSLRWDLRWNLQRGLQDLVEAAVGEEEAAVPGFHRGRRGRRREAPVTAWGGSAAARSKTPRRGGGTVQVLGAPHRARRRGLAGPWLGM